MALFSVLGKMENYPMKFIPMIWFLIASQVHALIAPQDWVIAAPDPELAVVRVVRTIGADGCRAKEKAGEKSLGSFHTFFMGDVE